MEFIGVYLKSIRIKRQCTIEELSNELMISQNLLTLIEEDNFPDHLSSVYTMGHIRSYANFFDLDADDYVEIYGRINSADAGTNTLQASNSNYFGAYRIIGA